MTSSVSGERVQQADRFGQLDLSQGQPGYRDRRRPPGFRAEASRRLGGIPPDDLLQGGVFRGGLTGFVQRGIIVVTGQGGLVAGLREPVGPVHEAEIGAAVAHIQAERGACRQDFIQGGYRVLRWAGVVGLAPVIEPTVPELGYHQGAIRLVLAQLQEGLPCSRSEIGGSQDSGQAAALEHIVRGAIGGEQRLLDPAGAQPVRQVLEISAVIAVGAVLVFNLACQQRPAAGDLERCQAGDEGIEETVDSRQVGRVRTAQAHGRVAQQPGRQAAARSWPMSPMPCLPSTARPSSGWTMMR